MPLTVATWNVNGIRARAEQVLGWLESDRPHVVCLQEIKATPAQVPASLLEHAGYWSLWHGAGGYSGVCLLFDKERFAAPPIFAHPEFDMETRVVAAEAGDLLFASIYVPNGGKDYAAKISFLEAMRGWAEKLAGRPVVLCGDWNVARAERDIHPKERKPNQIGARPEERRLIEEILGHGLVDVGRAQDPDNDDLFTWWAPWRNLRQRNIGWRIDYVTASEELAKTALDSRVLNEYGTSDHAPVVVTFGI
ncbi:MAG TPA: exodeoxyribonuclease III [Thermoanaerobaculia bacterium]|nr:exodeoxyribonuclease III [Thermoanaerobaculia bacterium]